MLLLSLFLTERASSTAVEKKSTTLSLNSQNNACGILESSCLDSQRKEEEGGTEQMSALAGMDDQATAASKADVDINTAPTSVAGLDEEEEEENSRNSSGGEGYVPERYIVGCGGDRVEAAKR